MTSTALGTRIFTPIWRHLRHADWPLLPLALAALLVGARVLGAQSYAYWNDWLTCFTALLAAYTLTASVRILLQSLCFDHPVACWVALFAAIGLCWSPSILIAYELSRMGLPMAGDFSFLFYALLAACLLLVPAEVKAERARWTRRAGRLQAIREREQRMERQLVEARLTALQGQIEPHFLYNTLANARALIRQDAAAAEQMLQHLIRFLRSAMPDLRAHSTLLGQELDRARAYLDIIGMRMGERLHFDIAASEEARACRVPPLSVMTLVENAIEHGIEPQVAGGTLRVKAVCAGGRLRIEVLDDGAGFRSELGGGVGLVNLQERLATQYGDDAELRIEPGPQGGVRAVIELPARGADAARADAGGADAARADAGGADADANAAAGGGAP